MHTFEVTPVFFSFILRYDCEKNSKMMLAQSHYSHKRLQVRE